jgi:hypothetical protein
LKTVPQGERLLAVLRLLRGDSEFIAFRDFAVFNLLMARPDPEYDIAFMLMDRGHKVTAMLHIQTFIRCDWLHKCDWRHICKRV